MIHIYISIGLVVLTVVTIFIARKQGSKAGLYDLYVEASNLAELTAGVPAFCSGIVSAVPGQPQLVAPYSKQPCVWYSFILEQEQLHRDANGAETTTWNIISNQAPQGTVFSLQTGTSSIQVNPASADIQKVQEYQAFVDPADTQGQSGFGAAVGNIANMLSSIGNSRLRVTEQYIPIGQQLYVGGVALEQNGQKTFMNDRSYPLVLTTRSKEDLVKIDRRSSVVGYVIASVFAITAIVIALAMKG